MRLIKPEAKLLLQQPGLEGVYKQIELAGRTCYKSTDKITEDSAKPFVDRMIKSKHLAMLEHGTVYLAIPFNDDETLSHYRGYAGKYNEIEFTKYSKVTMMRGTHNYVTTNLRVLVENGWMDDLKYICEPTEYHEKRYTFKVITSIGVTREFNRHRTMSIAEQSTRYCNYSKDKFGGEITFCLPRWIDNPKYITITPEIDTFFKNCETAEHNYLELINKNWKPQQAREVLPLCTATEAIYTAFTSDWQHFFELRYFGTTGAPHPNMLELSELIGKELIKHKLWNEIYKQNIEVDS